MTQQEFEHTLIRMRPRMFRIAMDFFRNEEEASDVVQEVYVRLLHRGWHVGDNTESLAIRATKNLCVSVWRRQRLQKICSLDVIPDTASHETADAPLLHIEQWHEIEEAIQQLSPSEQNLVRMRHQQDLTLDEITQKTGMTRRSASTIISSAKKKLLKLIKTQKDD